MGPGYSAFQLKVGALNALKEMAGSGIPPLTALLSMQDSRRSPTSSASRRRAPRGPSTHRVGRVSARTIRYGSAYDWLSPAPSNPRAGDVSLSTARPRMRSPRVAPAPRPGRVWPTPSASRSPLPRPEAANQPTCWPRSGPAKILRLPSAMTPSTTACAWGILLHETVALRDPEAFEAKLLRVRRGSRPSARISCATRACASMPDKGRGGARHYWPVQRGAGDRPRRDRGPRTGSRARTRR